MADKKKMRSEASTSRGSTSSSSSSTLNNNRGESEVVDVGRRRSSCGYCKSPGHTSISHGLWAHSLTVDDYEALLDRGWRRSGCFLYKPEMDKTCCPSYTIRLKASDFVPSKEQQRVSKRMQRFLDSISEIKKSDKFLDDSKTSKDSGSLVINETTGSAVKEPLMHNVGEKNKAEQFMHYLSDQIDNAVHTCIQSAAFPRDIQLPQTSVKRVAHGKRKFLSEGSEDLLYSSNVSFQIAAALRRGNKLHQMEVSGGCKEENEYTAELTPQVIADKLASHLNHLSEASGLSIRACNGHINFYSTTRQDCSDEVVERVTVRKKSCTESGDKGSCLKKFSGRLHGKRKRLEINLKRSTFDPEEYDLYRRYQIKVHNDAPDHVSENSYRRFLVETPLIFVPSNGDGTVPPCGFGSFHQQYVIDGRLVAVGVIDILPKCLSSKYLFWDPDFAFLSLGKYSARQEIDWVRENQAYCPSLQYYYLGYYIHSCNKMRYKAAYRPSELLCPLRYQWVPFDTAKPLLDRKPYVILSDFPNLQKEDSSTSVIESRMDMQHDDPCQLEFNNFPFDEDEEISDIDFEDSDDESGPEASVITSTEIDNASVGKIMIGLKGSRLRYKDIQQAFGPTERTYMESKLHRYMRAVGTDLSQRMVFSLG